MVNNEMLTVREVAERLRKHPRTIRRWIVAGKLKAEVIPGRGRTGIEYLIRTNDLEEFLGRRAADV